MTGPRATPRRGLLGLTLVASWICLGLGGCGAKVAAATTIFTRSAICADLRHASGQEGEAPAARAIDFELAYDRQSASDHDWIASGGMMLDQAYVADALGLATGKSTRATLLTIHYARPTPCASNQVSAAGQALKGCRTDGCRLEGRLDGGRVSALSVFVPARPNGDADAVTLTQGRCVVAAVGVAAGVQDLWRDDLTDAVTFGPSHAPGQAIYRWQVNPLSKFNQCLQAVRAEIK